jgi:hypothetical protein
MTTYEWTWTTERKIKSPTSRKGREKWGARLYNHVNLADELYGGR